MVQGCAKIRKWSSPRLVLRVVPSKDLGFWLQAYSVVDYQCSWIFHGEQKHGAALVGILRSILLWPFPMDHLRLDVPHFFRIRALPRFFFRRWLAFLSVDRNVFKDSSYCSIP